MENKRSFDERLNELNELVSKLQDESIQYKESKEIYNKCKKL